MKKIIIIICIFILSGCSDYVEINDLGLITGISIDYKDNLFIDNNPKELIKFQNKGGKIIRIRRIEDKYSVIDLDNVLEYKNFFDLKLEEII